ncbi:hypothetical protein KKB10_02915 [Patescibacteria group bacterium]|nr:hypothetical protein [Patescibacteria group bacterium]MBU1075267.1 hypothetical protein [Patescibacteria group bacterium]
MNKISKILLTILLIVVLGFGAYYTINEISTEDTNTATIINTTAEEEEITAAEEDFEYKTITFRDEVHAVSMQIPEQWKDYPLNINDREKASLLSFDVEELNPTSLEDGYPYSADLSWYNSNGIELNAWVEEHYDNELTTHSVCNGVYNTSTNDGYNGVEVVCKEEYEASYTNTGHSATRAYYFFSVGDYIYKFMVYLGTSMYTNMQPIIEEIKDSIVFGEPFNLDEWKTYASEDNGFSVKYPPVWYVSENWEQLGGFVGFDEIKDLFEGHKVTISTHSDEGYTSSLAGQTRLENTQLSYPHIGGVPAVRISGIFPEPTYGFSDYTDSVFVMSDGLGIEMAYQETGFDLESRETFSQMLRTFEFIK